MGLLAWIIGSLLVHFVTTVSIINDVPPSQANEPPPGVDGYIYANRVTNVGEGIQLYDGDIAMTQEEEKTVFGEKGNEKRGATKSSLGQLWEGSPPTVPYEISDDLKKTSANGAIKDAMAEIETATCIRFRERESTDDDYVSIIKADGCWSRVGRRGGGQSISLGSPSCWNKRIAVHELMHALGFYHEQSRPDRDDYVIVLKDNIQGDKISNFNKYDRSVIDSLDQPYDYNSVLHYQNKDFAIDSSKDTLQKIDDPTYRLGQSSPNGGLTKSDTAQLNILYKCKNCTAFNSCPKQIVQCNASEFIVYEKKYIDGCLCNIEKCQNSTVAPTTISPKSTTTKAPVTPKPKPPKPRCGLRCLIWNLIWRMKRRRRITYRRRRRFFYRRRRRFSRRNRFRFFRWGKKKDTQQDEKSDEEDGKPIVNLDNILAQLDEEDKEIKLRDEPIKSDMVKTSDEEDADEDSELIKTIRKIVDDEEDAGDDDFDDSDDEDEDVEQKDASKAPQDMSSVDTEDLIKQLEDVLQDNDVDGNK